MTDTRMTVRDELVQALAQNLHRDLSDLRNLSDVRIRFIPRQALIDTLSPQQVVRLLCTTSKQPGETDTLLQDVVRYISPQAESCHCQKVECTGARKILAALLLIGKEDLISTIFPSTGRKLCDQDLPFGTKIGAERRDSQGDHDEGVRSPASSTAETYAAGAEVDPAFFRRLNTSEKDLFCHLQWQFITPYITDWGMSETGAKERKEISLPWQEVERIEDSVEGKYSFVHKVTIFPGNHNLTQHVDNIFALKTFEETIVSGLTQERYDKELKAHRNAPRHNRIVPVLAAVQHRRNCHLIFPWADGGSLLSVWENYSPTHIESRGNTQPATWCSEAWLLNECIGIAEALTATHGLTNDTHFSRIRQLHADIKPENILCFFSDHVEGRSLTLKLADLGEAIQVDDGDEIDDDIVPHTKTYRPPENNPLGQISFNYDIWCLGCVFVDFITWYLEGWEGIEAFRVARENEGDDPSIAESDGPAMIEDIFFRRVRKKRIPSITVGAQSKTSNQSGQHTVESSLWITSRIHIKHEVKKSVLTHIQNLKGHDECSLRLKQFISYVARKMLVVDTQDRAESNDVLIELKSLVNTVHQ